MTLRICQRHGEPVRDASLCDTCVDELERDLANLGALADELVTMLTRQDRVLRPPTPLQPDTDPMPLTAKVQPLPFDERAGNVLAATRLTLVGWVRVLHDSQPGVWLADGIPAMTAWLLGRASTQIRVHPAGDQLAVQVAELEDAASRTVDLCPDLWFAGVCGALRPGFPEMCPEWLYAEMRTGMVECRRCHTKHDVAERRQLLLDAADDQLETATHLAQALTRLGEPVTPERIRKWSERGRLAVHGVDPNGHPMYRVGEVRRLLDEAAEREARRAG